MADFFTKGAARNIYYGGSVFFILVFLGLTLNTVEKLPERDHRENITENVEKGKLLWEENNCIGCHTLLGEGAYYAPELGNVFYRRGNGDSATFNAFMQGWMAAQPIPVEGRRKMPQFNLSEEQVNQLSDFLEWTAKVNTEKWPPNIEG